MTLFVADIAAYQGNLTLGQLRDAGVGAVNVKVAHGVGLRSVHPEAAAYVHGARLIGMGVSTFHWLDGSAPGEQQAEHAFAQLRALGLQGSGFVHVVDCEADATLEQYVTYVTRMQQLLGRQICTYTGDWWFSPRGWAGATPWLWAAPNAGYLSGYPGDDAPHWRAGYGGWADLAAMQYQVGDVAGVRVSLSAVRSMDVWVRMTGGDVTQPWVLVPALRALRAEFNQVFPARDRASDGAIGDQAHATGASGHNPDESGVPERHDADSVNEVRALDVDVDLRHPGVTMEQVVQYLLRECRAGRITWILYLIFNRRIWTASGGWVQQPYSGANPHDKHLHVSCKPDTASENNDRPVGLASLVGDDMTPAEMTAWAKSAEGRAAIWAAVNPDKIQRYDGNGVALPVSTPPGEETMTPATALAYLGRDVQLLRQAVGKALTGLTDVRRQVTALDTRESAEVPAGVDAIADAVVARMVAMPEVSVDPGALREAIVGAVHDLTAPGAGQ